METFAIEGRFRNSGGRAGIRQTARGRECSRMHCGTIANAIGKSKANAEPALQPVVLYDGGCGFCAGWIRFLLRADRKERFLFSARDSGYGRRALSRVGGPKPLPDSVMLLEGGWLYTESEAALRIARLLGFPWAVAAMFRVVPGFLRDAVYRLVARHRRRWPGSTQVCDEPGDAARRRFLE